MTDKEAHEYNPMSVQSEVDEIYSNPEILEHARLLRSISQEATRRRFRTNPRFRIATNIILPELFGDYGKDRTKEPPIAPTEV